MTKAVFDQIVDECLSGITTTQLKSIVTRELRQKLYPAILDFVGKRPVIWNGDADVANRYFGESYGVDWVYS